MASKRAHGKSKAMQIQSTLVPIAAVPKGIMVSPGRYVNLAKGPATLEERVLAHHLAYLLSYHLRHYKATMRHLVFTNSITH
jgi:hypothetical protein